MLTEALKFKQVFGWNVIPIAWVLPNGTCSCGDAHAENPKQIGKHPLVPWKQYQTRGVTEEDIQTWWTRWPKANIAVITGSASGIYVVDDDHASQEGGRYQTLTAKSGGGGHHYFFSTRKVLPNTSRKIDSHTDTRGEGGYIILPPSNHVSGERYRWYSKEPIAPLPQSLLAMLNGADPAVKEGKLFYQQGQRNDQMIREIGRIFGHGKDPKECLNEIRKWNQERCDPPLSDGELVNGVTSIWKKERAKKDEEAKSKGEKGGLSILSFTEMWEKYGTREETWLIDGWLPAETFCVIGGPPESYKTWLMLHMALCITRGTSFLGKYPVEKKGKVLVIQQEDNYASLIARTLKLANSIEVEEYQGDWRVPFIDEGPWPEFTDDRLVNLDNKEGLDALEEHISKERPVLVIIDPLSSMINLDDFGTKASQVINSRLKRWRDQYGVAFMFVHHINKSAILAEAKGGRRRDSMWGSTFINAMLETEIDIRTDGEGSDMATIYRRTKQAGHKTAARIRWDITPYYARIELQED